MSISKLLLATILAGSIGLTTIGLTRAQSAADTTTTSMSTTVTAEDDATATGPMRHMERHQQRLEGQAASFGMTVDELKAEIEAGKPFYQIAAEHGVTYEDLKTDRLKELKTRLDDMVNVGFMTQDQANATYQEAQSHNLIGGPGFGHGHGGPMM